MTPINENDEMQYQTSNDIRTNNNMQNTTVGNNTMNGLLNNQSQNNMYQTPNRGIQELDEIESQQMSQKN